MIFYVDFTKKLFFSLFTPDFSSKPFLRGVNSLKQTYVEGGGEGEGVHIKRTGTNKGEVEGGQKSETSSERTF